ncbi:MAG: helix-turn-helix domain-containing protein [Hyphomicrobiaceae bacterium]|nr:helix-turn-helix domain-containing protein [Hyphomicrobiaceae bacterium]
MTEFRTTTIVVPESPRDEADNRVFGLLVNGRGELFVDPDGNPVLLPAPPLTLHAAEDPNERLSWREAAEKAGVSLSTVRRAVQDGQLPEPDRVAARARRFRLADVRAWIDGEKRPAAVALEEWMRQRARKNRA